MKIGLHIADFTWPGGPAELGRRPARVATAAEDAGFARVSVMDHVWQIGAPRTAGARDARGVHDAGLSGGAHVAGRARRRG